VPETESRRSSGEGRRASCFHGGGGGTCGRDSSYVIDDRDPINRRRWRRQREVAGGRTATSPWKLSTPFSIDDDDSDDKAELSARRPPHLTSSARGLPPASAHSICIHMMSNAKQSSPSHPPLARNPTLHAIRNRSQTTSIPVPPSLLAKPHLQAMTLPPTALPFRNHADHPNPKPATNQPGYGHVGAKEDSWLRDTIPAAYDTGDGSSRSRASSHSTKAKHVPSRCLSDSINYPPHTSGAHPSSAQAQHKS
jgi:hypothetical protein